MSLVHWHSGRVTTVATLLMHWVVFLRLFYRRCKKLRGYSNNKKWLATKENQRLSWINELKLLYMYMLNPQHSWMKCRWKGPRQMIHNANSLVTERYWVNDRHAVSSLVYEFPQQRSENFHDAFDSRTWMPKNQEDKEPRCHRSGKFRCMNESTRMCCATRAKEYSTQWP